MAEASAPRATGPGAWPVAAVGCTALAALRTSGGGVRRLPGSSFWLAGDEVVWLAGSTPLPHPRAFALAFASPGPADDGVLAIARLRAWRPSLPSATRRSPAGLARAARALAAALPVLETPRGLGLLLRGAAPDFPMQGALGHMALVAHAACAGSGAGVPAAVRGLIGLGAGLTPSGDDYLAGIAFATRLRAAADARARRHGAAIRGAIRAAVPARTNRVSAALLGDATGGFGFRAMHDLCAALAAEGEAEALAAARRLCAIGHSSGWDLLVGLLAGLGGVRLGADQRQRRR